MFQKQGFRRAKSIFENDFDIKKRSEKVFRSKPEEVDTRRHKSEFIFHIAKLWQ